MGTDERWIEVQGMSEADVVLWVESFKNTVEASLYCGKRVANGDRVYLVGVYSDGDIFEYDRNY